MKVFIGVGHGGSDPGAVANGLKESNINLGIAKVMKSELEKRGVTVLMSRECDINDPLSEEIKECNAFAPNLAVDIHTNAGGGKGFEIYYQTNSMKSKSISISEAIEKKVLEIGQNSRGLKTRLNTSGTDYFGFLRQINCPSVITECAFIDSTRDVLMINTEEKQREFGKAYALGVLEYLGINEKNITLNTDTNTATTTNTNTTITGISNVTTRSLEDFLYSKNPSLDSEYIETLAYFYHYYGNIENIKSDIAFAQACLETGYFKFGGDVKKEQNNFCGLGAVGGGACGNSFNSIGDGVLAHIQHLKAYANTENLVTQCIDPRFTYVQRGISPYIEWLGSNENPNGKGWATDIGYGSKILSLLKTITTFNNLNNTKNTTNTTIDTSGVENNKTTSEEFIIPNWAMESVNWAVKNKIILGNSKGDLMLENNVTRLEICAFLYRLYLLTYKFKV